MQITTPGFAEAMTRIAKKEEKRFYCNLCGRVRYGDAVTAMYGYDKMCLDCQKRVEDGLLVDTSLKVYHWESVVTLQDNEYGQVIIVAGSLEQATESMQADLVPELSKKVPIIYPVDLENPWVVAIEGGS